MIKVMIHAWRTKLYRRGGKLHDGDGFLVVVLAIKKLTDYYSTKQKVKLKMARTILLEELAITHGATGVTLWYHGTKKKNR